MTGSRTVPAREPSSADAILLHFQSPSAAVVHAPVPTSAARLVSLICSMVVVLIAIIALVPIDRVVSARGLVVSQAPTILVQPLETAIVRSIDVREGEVVNTGQVLARLDPTFVSADAAALEAQRNKLQAEVARLTAEASGAPFSYEGTDPSWSLQAAIYAARKAQHQAKLDNYNHRIHELDATLARSRAAAATYRERLGIAHDLEQMRKQLESLHAGTHINTLAAVDSRLDVQRSLSDAENTAEATTRDQDALVAERDAFLRGWTAETSQTLSETRAKAEDTQEQLTKAAHRRKLVELRAQTDAVVQSVARVSIGSVMQSGQQFLTLVPIGSQMEVEANIPARENGFVHVRDPASIKFDTFPYAQYGAAEGAVHIVSPDSFSAQSEARNPTGPVVSTDTDAFYRARISIDKVGLRDVPEQFRMIPGMPVSVDIKVGKRTVLSYLLGSTLPVFHEGMREP
ncbi:HlyD family type I secretion periplasmic adaptor subunit [Bradyrhizobium sp. STM 3557]|uniref:HlyD family type I secretion periplasmic adaptor subunit n=1 Tax=Bradyrhizobium sp. STM 3557 TaxID=578920 RepID=UPI00388CF554